jgi:hypothetical protein
MSSGFACKSAIMIPSARKARQRPQPMVEQVAERLAGHVFLCKAESFWHPVRQY